MSADTCFPPRPDTHPTIYAYEDTWYFSVIDVVAALMDSVNPRDYWFKMKIRAKTEDGFELSTICRQLNLQVSVGYA